MRADEWAMAHALLSGAINLGLLHPLEVIEGVERAYAQREDVPLSSAEGCIRQVLGWREFMRHVYQDAMPELTRANQLEADRSLPDLYWAGETGMNCLSETIEDVLESIVGDLRDGFDRDEPTIHRREDGYDVDGGVALSVVAEVLGADIDPNGVDTIAGLVLDRLGRVPDPGTRIDLDGWTVEVTDVDGTRIETLRIVENETGDEFEDEDSVSRRE